MGLSGDCAYMQMQDCKASNRGCRWLAAVARVERTDARSSRAVVKTALTCWILVSKVVRFWGPCPEREKKLVTVVGSVTSSSRKEVIADVAGLFSLIFVDGARASCRWMDAWGTRHSYRSLIMLNILTQVKFLRRSSARVPCHPKVSRGHTSSPPSLW
jgi:hypothetical protein